MSRQGAVYALLVGINEYDGAVRRLYGCVNDIQRLELLLRTRVPVEQLHMMTLLDDHATREAVLDGLRRHLTKAAAGDVALFSFSGHGSRERTKPEFWFREPDGMNSTILCYDSRTPGRRAWDLADKELGAQLDVIASAEPHVVVVLDCCHSGGGTRDVVEQEAAASGAQLASGPLLDGVREVDPIDEPRPLETYIPELRDGPGIGGARDYGLATPSVGRHVALFACESFQKAREIDADGIARGAFSVALEAAIARLGPTATYQDLIVSVRSRVTDHVRDQYPLLYTVDRADASLVFLGGRLARGAGTFTLFHTDRGWSLDGGACHGIAAPVGDESTTVAILQPRHAAEDVDVLGTARVVAVEPATARVSLDAGTDLVEDALYPVVVVGAPLPPAEVAVSGDEGGVAAVLRCLANSGPDGGPSPHVRVVEHHRGDGLQLDVVADPDGFRLIRPDGSRVTADVPSGDDAAQVVADRLEHIAQWDQIRRLENPGSRLNGKVRLWVAVGKEGEAADRATLPAGRLEPDNNGVVRLAYASRDPDAHPNVFVVAESSAPRPLYVAVVDLTDRFKMTAYLGDGWLYPEQPFVGWNGQAAPFTIPKDRLTAALADRRPAVVRDWIKLVAAEERFEPSAFLLPALDEPTDRAGDARAEARSTIDRIAGRALTRDVPDVPPAGAVADWTTVTIELVTQLPLV